MMKEYSEQKVVAEYLDLQGVLYTATANGLRTYWKQARRAKASGVKSGVPDLLIFEWSRNKEYCGLAIEMKREMNAQVSNTQKIWIEELNKRGWYACICRGAKEAIKTINWYLKEG